MVVIQLSWHLVHAKAPHLCSSTVLIQFHITRCLSEMPMHEQWSFEAQH